MDLKALAAKPGIIGDFAITDSTHPQLRGGGG